MEELKRLWRRGKRFRGRALAGAACAVLAAPAAAAMAHLLKVLQGQLSWAEEHGATGVLDEYIKLWIVVIPAVFLYKGALTYAATYLLAWNAQAVIADLRTDLYRSLLERPISYLAGTQTGELVSRVTNDVQRLEIGLSARLADVAAASKDHDTRRTKA